MRIAFSGTHRVGKTTLVERVADALSAYTTVDEPYSVLEEEGYESCDPPSVQDFEAQLERSLVTVEESGQDVLFDRCPADILAYLLVQDDTAEDWIERTREAMQTLDLVVFVSIEEPDRIALASHEDRGYRRAVHERLHQLLVDDELGLEIELLMAHGDVAARVAQVLARITDR